MERSPLKSFVDEPHAAIEGPVQISGRGKSIGTTGHSIPPYPTPPEGWENWPLFGLVDRDHMAEWVPRLWQLIFADNAAEIPDLKHWPKPRKAKPSIRSLSNPVTTATYRLLATAFARGATLRPRLSGHRDKSADRRLCVANRVVTVPERTIFGSDRGAIWCRP